MLTPVANESFSQNLFSPPPRGRQNNVYSRAAHPAEERTPVRGRWGTIALRILSATSYIFKLLGALVMALYVKVTGRNVFVVQRARDILKPDTKILEARREGLTRKIAKGENCSEAEQTLLLVINCVLILRNIKLMDVREMKPTAIAKSNGTSLFTIDFRRRQTLRVEYRGVTHMIEAVGRSHTDLLRQVNGGSLAKRFGLTPEEWHHALEFTLHSVPAVPLRLMQEACQSHQVTISEPTTIENLEVLFGDASEEEVTGLSINDEALVTSYEKKMKIVKTDTLQVLGTITLSVEYKFVRGALCGKTISETDDNLYEGSWKITDFTIFP